MAGDKDILDKADALLRRHVAPGSGIGSDTGGVPVLTDIIGDHGAAAPAATAPAAPAPAAADPSSELAAEIFRRVMGEVERRLAGELEHRLLQRLTPQIHAAVAGAIIDLRQELANAIAEAVAEAFARRNVK